MPELPGDVDDAPAFVEKERGEAVTKVVRAGVIEPDGTDRREEEPFAPLVEACRRPFAAVVGWEDVLGRRRRRAPLGDIGIDVGSPTSTDGGRAQLLEAERAHLRAVARRRSAEGATTRWLPGPRRQLHDARREEAEAGARLRDLRRQEIEQRHAARPFLSDDELAQRSAERAERLADRNLQRSLTVHRGLER